MREKQEDIRVSQPDTQPLPEEVRRRVRFTDVREWENPRGKSEMRLFKLSKAGKKLVKLSPGIYM